MDTVALVTPQIEEGQRLVGQLTEEALPVVAACWAKPADDDNWSLYLSMPIVDQKGPLGAYNEVLRVLRSLDAAWLSASDIVLVGERHPITQDVLGLLSRLSDGAPARAKQSLLGGTAVSEVCVYPVKRRNAHTELNDGQKHLLESLYTRSPLAVDDLPYTAELELIHRDFVKQTGLAFTIRDVFKALKNLGRHGRLGGKLRSPVSNDPGETPAAAPPP